jgi:hypothetical protein
MRQILGDEDFVRDGIQGGQHIHPLASRRRFDKQPFNTPHHPHPGGIHNMGGSHQADGALVSLRFRSPRLQCIFLKASWAATSALAWAHPEPVQKLPHLRRLAGNPRKGFDSGCHFRHGGRRMLAKLGFDRRPVWMQGTARPTRLAVFQLLDSAGAIGVAITMEARFGHPTQSRDIAIGNP